MGNNGDFKSFYNEKLLPDLQILETQRKIISSKIIQLIVFAFFIAALFLFFDFEINANDAVFDHLIVWPFIVQVIIFLAFVIYKGYQIRNRYLLAFLSTFKQKIIKSTIRYFDENLIYEPKMMISQDRYKSSAIFPEHVDRYTGGDLVYGKTGKTDIMFSKVFAEYESKSKDSSSWVTIFKGIYFIADFNKNFNSRTVVLPDTAEKIFGNLGGMLQKMNLARDPLVKLEDMEFEKEFVVYGKDQIEARYILSPALMHRILDYKRKSGGKIYLSFVDSSVHVAIPVFKELFEPRIFRTIVDFNLMYENYRYLALCLSIVDELNLNLRIWTKE